MRRGDEFDTQFREQYPKLVSELDFMLGNFELARDVAQEAFMRQYVAWPRVRKLDKPGAWVRKVAIRLAVRTRRKWLLWGEIDDDVAAPVVDTDRVLDVRNAVLRLPGNQRACVVLYYYRDLPIEEVAAAVGCSPATAKVHLHRARERLATMLTQYAAPK